MIILHAKQSRAKIIVQLYVCKASVFLLQMEIKSISAYAIHFFFYKIVTINRVWEGHYLFYGM